MRTKPFQGRCRRVVAVAGWLLAVAPAQVCPWLAPIPDAALVVVRCVDPPAAMAALLAAVGSVPAGMPETVQAQVGVGVAMVRAFFGGDVVAFVDRMARGGVAVGWQLAESGPMAVVVLRPGDAAAARRWCAEHAPQWRVRAQDDCLVLSQGAAPIPPGGRWATMPFGEAAAVQAEIDLAALRLAAGAKWPSWEQLDGPVRVLFGPLLYAFGAGTRGRLELHATDRLRLCASVDASLLDSPLGGLLAAAEPRVLLSTPDSSIASLRLDRSFTRLLRAPQQFLSPAQVIEVQSFLSIADLIDGANTSFVDDLLGGLAEPFVLHVLPTASEAGVETPLLALPEFALVAPLRTPAAGELMIAAARVLLTITNVERQQQGRRQFLVRPMRTETGHGLVAEPMPWRGPGALPIEQALTPTVWIERGHVALATTQGAAMQVMQGQAMPLAAPTGDRLSVRGPALAAWVAVNRSVLELARRLEEGEDRVSATRFYDIVQAVVGALRSVSLSVDVTAAGTAAELVLERQR